MVKIPSGSFNFLNRDSAHPSGPHERVNQASRVERNAILNSTNCLSLYFLLDFPGDHLNNEIFSAGTQNGKINVKVSSLL